jgi:hypothetical protein
MLSWFLDMKGIIILTLSVLVISLGVNLYFTNGNLESIRKDHATLQAMCTQSKDDYEIKIEEFEVGKEAALEQYMQDLKEIDDYKEGQDDENDYKAAFDFIIDYNF